MKKILSVFFLACCSCIVMAQDNVIDEIVWVVGDDAILRSDIETQRLYNQNEGVRVDGDPYCVIPEQMAIQKLYLNQAKIDSITVNENQVIQSVDQWMNMAVNQIGSREKLEEYFGKKFSQIKDERKEMVREQQVVQQMQHQLIGEIKLTPSEVRKYFSQLSQDSLPNIPTTVEVQIVTLEPKIPFEEAATFVSYDKDTRNNKGLMVNQDYESSNMGTPKFEMQELPQEIGKVVYGMKVGEISKPFTMLTNKQKEVVAIVKLKARTEGHKANLADDFQALKAIVEAKKREELLNDWITKKQKSTYVRISDGWRNCDFKYPGWIKE